MTILLRTLTPKSKLGFGRQWMRMHTIKELIDLQRTKEIIEAYYKLSMINYSNDLIDLLKIERIPKPSKLPFKEADIKTKECHRKYLESLKENDIYDKESLKMSAFVRKQVKARNIKVKSIENLLNSKTMNKMYSQGKNKKSF